MNISSASVSLMQAQVLGSLAGPAAGAGNGGSWAAMFSLLLADGIRPGSPSSLTSPGSINFLPASGRNMALFDPESAYRMMTVINNRDVSCKAQFSELSQVQSSVARMEQAGRSLGGMAPTTDNDGIKLRLQDFVGQYNGWVQQINADLQPGGLLADTQAAQASRFELEQNFNNPLFGGGGGVQGLRAMGITVDPVTHQATLDVAMLDALLAANKQGVVDAVQEFGANFAKSASLLNAEGNFILKQLDNLGRAIRFIADNRAALREEFGAGSAAQPTGQIARALAAYNRICAVPG